MIIFKVSMRELKVALSSRFLTETAHFSLINATRTLQSRNQGLWTTAVIQDCSG